MPPRKSKGPRTSGPRRGPAERPPESFVEDASPRPPSAPFPTVGIGASAGGLDAFTEILRALPPDTGMAFVVIQHLDPTHASMLPEILGRATSMPVTEVADQMVVKPNHVYVIPPGVTMAITRGTLQLTPRREVKGQHRPIDHFLRALAEDQGHRAIGVILSGSATDGTLGLEAIKAEGGITFAQDESAQHTSMPNSAIAAGCVDFVLPPAEIAQEIARISRHPYVTRGAEEILSSPGSEPSLSRVLDQLRVATGVDFSSYKRNTLLRRITRRAVLHKMDGLRDYARFLQGDPAETEALYQDVLISVTSFFRNSDAFEILKSKVFPRLVKDRSRHDPVRVWSIGCSTGEEAYAIAIAWAEFSEAARLQIPLQVFATDLNGASIEKARAGIYRRSIVQDVSPERLRRFFFESDGTYRISKAIRDTTVFARHNVLTEPPFSRIDLISCRNLLIYLELSLQQKAMGMMHYALKPGGVLWLGSSETIGSYRDLFDVEDGKYKMYVKKPGPPRLVPRALSTDMPAPRRAEPSAREVGVAGPDVHREADRILLAKYTPPSVLVNADMEILQFRGDTGPYLTPAPGKASLNLLKMLRDGLLVGIRAALHRAKREETPIREDGLQVRSNGGFRQVNVHVVPIRGTTPASPLHFVVLFEDVPGVDAARSPKQKGKARRVGAADRKTRESESIERETARLTQELAATREYLQSVIEQQEAANEELQSSNEEVQSANEELQSINEELETSKEEVQSSNEELATVNEELQNRNVELGQSNNDFINLLASVQLPIVMLGPDLRIRRFTPMAEKLLNIIGADVGRRISDIKLGVAVPDLEPTLLEVMEAVTVKEIEVRDKLGRWHMLRMRPYRTQDNRIDGVVLVLIDVDAIKRDQETLRRQNALLDQVSEAIFMWEPAGGIVYWNRGAQETYGLTQEQALGRKPYELLATSPPADVFLDALQSQGRWTGELIHTGRDGTRIVVESRMIMEHELDGFGLVLEVNHPITERKQMEESLRAQAAELLAADRAKDEFLAVLAHELRNPLSPLTNALEIAKNPSAPPALVERAWQIMTHQVQNMARLVDDLLDVSRISQGRIQLRRESVDAIAVVGRAIEATRQVIDSREQELAFSAPAAPVVAEVDPLRLEQIVSNLLSNASKFTPRGGHIWVSVGDEASESRELVIRVRDDGIGISAAALPRLFDLFMQEDASIDRAAGGLGIGLTLVRHLVELHGGRVEAHSPGPGHGSEFVVRMPGGGGTLREPSFAARSGSAEPRPLSRRVLVTDDNGDGAEALAILLRLVGHDVQVAHSGPETIELGLSFRPDVIFLDIGMPGMDGVETARRLRGMPGFESTVIVALTGYGQASDRRRAFDAGFDDFLVKPPNPAAVRALSLKRRPSGAEPDQAADS
jgi:two-component system, chemotaxis family, CheB/CheR fusion protein